MKRSIILLAVMIPLSLWADSDTPVPLDTWQLVENSLRLNVQAIIFQGDGEEVVPASPFITLELFNLNSAKDATRHRDETLRNRPKWSS